MINPIRNREINERLTVLYSDYRDDYLRAYAEAFADDCPPRFINRFGIVDESRYDADSGVLFIAKETNGWDNEDYDNGVFFRDWLRGISIDGVAGKRHVQRHPIMWYNLGRWAMFLNDPSIPVSTIKMCKVEALHEIGTIAYTNVNKVRGKNQSRDEYWKLAYSDISGVLLRAELDIIRPKIVVCCGTIGEFRHHVNAFAGKVIQMPHPAARMGSENMLIRIAEQI